MGAARAETTRPNPANRGLIPSTAVRSQPVTLNIGLPDQTRLTMTVANPLANPLADPWTDRFLDRRHLWRVLRASHVYRLALAALLLAAFGLDEQSRLFGKQNPELFLGVALGYMALTLFAIAGSYWRRPRLPVQAHLQMLVDLVALTVLIHASGGLMSSLNSLLITAVAASGILLPLSSALLAAALGFFLLIGSWLASQWQAAEAMARTGRGSGGWSGLWERLGQVSDDWVRLGVLGAALFIAAALTYALAERARRGEGLARRRTLELLEVAELNQGIIRHLQNGVVVVDGGGRVLLLNDTARDALGWTDTGSGMTAGGTVAAAGGAPPGVAGRRRAGGAGVSPGRASPGTDSALHPTERTSSRQYSDSSGGFRTGRRAAATNQAGGAGPADRWHRPRDPQSAGGDQPRRAIAAGIHQRPAPAPATGDWRKSFTITSSAPIESSPTCSIWPGATGSSRSG